MYRVLGWTSRPSPRPWSALLVAIAGVVTFACSDDPVEPEISQSAALRVTPFAAQQLAVGDTLPLTAEVLDQNGEAVTGTAVTWASDNTLVATVDTAGVVTAVGEGAATITAESGRHRCKGAICGRRPHLGGAVRAVRINRGGRLDEQ